MSENENTSEVTGEQNVSAPENTSSINEQVAEETPANTTEHLEVHHDPATAPVAEPAQDPAPAEGTVSSDQAETADPAPAEAAPVEVTPEAPTVSPEETA